MEEILFSTDLNEAFLENIASNIPFKNEEVAIKLHMGEPENPNHLKPEEVKP